MADKSTILPKKLISLNKTFNTFPSTKSKESKEAKQQAKASISAGTSGGSFDSSSPSTTESTECLASRKTSLFSTRFGVTTKADKFKYFTSKSVDVEKATGSEQTKKSNDSRKSKQDRQPSINDDNQVASAAKQQTSSKSNKSANKSTFKYSSFFTSASGTKTTSILSKTSASTGDQNAVKPTSTLSTIYSTTSSLSNSPKSPSTPVKSVQNTSPNSKGGKQSSKTSTSNQADNLSKINKNKTKFEVPPQRHADPSSKTNSTSKQQVKLNDKKTSSFKSSSQALKSKTAKTINTIVKPIKRSSLRFENKKLLFASSSKSPKIVENLVLDEVLDLSPSDKRITLDDQYVQSNSAGLKVSFDEEMKIDRHRSNSDNARISKKQNLISSLRRSIFANQELQMTRSSMQSDRSLSIPNKSLSNRMMGMISKGKNHLAIVRSHSLESKFSSKRKNQQISKSQSKLNPLIAQSNEPPPFDEYKFLPLKWSFANDKLDENLIYIKFFKFYRCYDLIPSSSKLLIFDTQLLVKKAFSGLVTHGIKCAPLWCCKSQCFVGMLTISYFINILINQHESNCNLQSTHFEEQKLDSYKDYYTLSDQFSNSNFISIDPDANVFDAIHLLIKYKIHRLPVLDPLTQNVIYVLTHKRILKFLFIYYTYLPSPNFLRKSIHELKIGTYENIETVTPVTCLLNALNKFIKNNISSLPIVDDDGKLLDVFCKFDLFNLAANKMYSNLDINIKKALEQRVDSNCELLVTCFAHTSLHNVIELFVLHEAHRLIIIDECDRVAGIICLSDVLAFLITEHNDQLIEEETVQSVNDDVDLIKDRILTKLNVESELCKQTDLKKEIAGEEKCSDTNLDKETTSTETKLDDESNRPAKQVKELKFNVEGELCKETSRKTEKKSDKKESNGELDRRKVLIKETEDLTI